MSASSLKGAIAEAAIAAQAIELGIVELRPLMEGRRYDLVFDIDHRLYRAQCRSTWSRAAGRSTFAWNPLPTTSGPR